MRNTSGKTGFPHYSLSGDMTNSPKAQLPTNRLRLLVAIASGVILIVATVAGIFGFAAQKFSWKH